MIPVLTTEEMRAADAAAASSLAPGVLLARAGVAVGSVAATMLGRTYGRRVAIIVGPGFNGVDGHLAGEHLQQRGARVIEYSLTELPGAIEGVDLIIDAAFGIGCSRPFVAPRVIGDIPVLAVDLPSGVESDTGELLGTPLVADVTIALGALKPAHFLSPSAQFCGEVVLNTLDIPTHSSINLIEASDVSQMIQTNSTDHKWMHALYVAAGSQPMSGAAALVCAGALAAGASMVRLRPFGELQRERDWPDEVVLEANDEIDERCRAVVIGPGVGQGSAAQAFADHVVRSSRVPVVLDADGITRERIALGQHGVPMVVTPHGGEFRRLLVSPSVHPIVDARDVAHELGVTVLLKGPLTVVASPEGEVRLVTSGTPALATAGTGDVLAGIIGAALTRGLNPLDAASLGACLHGLAGQGLAPYGQASRMDDAVRQVLRELDHGN